MKSDWKQFCQQWKKELKRAQRQLKFWTRMCSNSVIRTYAEHRVCRVILYLAVMLRKVCDDYDDTLKIIIGSFETEDAAQEELSEYAIDWQASRKEILVLECPFSGDESFIRHQAIADYYGKGEFKGYPIRQICNQIIHSYIWTMTYKTGKLYGLAVSSDRYTTESLYIIPIEEMLKFLDYCKETVISSAYNLGIIENKLKLYEVLYDLSIKENTKENDDGEDNKEN